MQNFQWPSQDLEWVVSWGPYVDSAACICAKTTAISIGMLPQKYFDFEVQEDIYIDVIRAKIS